MNAATLITGLYPPAVRDRWGADISDELAATGPRSWPDAVTGAVRLWLHPSTWPETFTGQTRHVAAVALFVVTAATMLILRAVEPTPAVTADAHHIATSLWLAPTLLGMALAAPLPPLHWATLRRMTVITIRTLTGPAAALSAMVLTARTGVVRQTSGLTDAALVAYYWGTLAFAAAGMCMLVARTAKAAVLRPHAASAPRSSSSEQDSRPHHCRTCWCASRPAPSPVHSPRPWPSPCSPRRPSAPATTCDHATTERRAARRA